MSSITTQLLTLKITSKLTHCAVSPTLFAVLTDSCHIGRMRATSCAVGERPLHLGHRHANISDIRRGENLAGD